MILKALVALVYRTGGDYTPEYVERLAAAAVQHGAEAVEVMTDCRQALKAGRIGEAKAVPLIYGYRGWWSKIDLFKRYTSQKVVYFDLDTLITHPIAHILRKPYHRLTMMRGPLTGNPNSSCMAWQGDYSYIATNFRANPTRHQEHYKSFPCIGDQAFIADEVLRKYGWPVSYWDIIDCMQDLHPGSFVDRKTATLAERQRAAVVCYRGRPRPHQTGWAI